MNFIQDIVASFETNLRSVQKLVDFDQTVLEFAIENVTRLKNELDNKHPSIADRVGNTLNAIVTVRDHESMRSHYATIYNQCVVLLVSHFGATLHSLFITAAPALLGTSGDKDALKDELKFQLSELCEHDFDIRERIGELLVNKRDISFQDMQGTSRAFKAYLGVEMPARDVIDDIILAQAARNAIVHAGGVIDRRLLKQVSGATARTVKPTLRDGENLSFTPHEVEVVATKMRQFVACVAEQVRNRPEIERQ